MGNFNYYPHAIKFFSAAALWSLVTYIPIFAKEIGLSDTQIAVIASLYAASLFFATYFFGRLADIIGRRSLIILGLFLSTLSFLLYIFAKDFVSLLLIRMLSGVTLSMQASALVAYAHDVGHKLGKLSSFDALGVTFGSILIGIVAFYFDIVSIFILSAIFFAVAFLVSLKLEKVKHVRLDPPLFPHHILKRNFPIYISLFIRQAAANSIWVFWGLYLVSLGANLFWIGMVTAVNTLTQFFAMQTVSDKIKINTMITLGTLFSAVAFLIFGLATHFWQILVTEIIIGVSWAFLYVGSIRWITDNTKEKATGIGLLSSFINLAMLIGPLIATVIIPFGGYRLIMFVAAALAFGSFLVFDVLRKGNY